MIRDDRARIIGKITSIKSDRFSVELLSGIRNFNFNGFDDIHYFAQLNSYVVIPCQNYYIVAEVVGVYEQDSFGGTNSKEQELNKVYSNKFLEVLPIGALKTNSKKVTFEFGVSIYPTLYSDVLYIKDDELDAIFMVREAESQVEDKKTIGDEKTIEDEKTRLNALEVGKSAIFSDYSIKIDIDKFFGAHSAILGNTGSGKSCTIASIMQTLYKKKNYSAIGSTFIFFDVNGEYKQAFKEMENEEIKIKYLSFGAQNDDGRLTLPHYLLNIEEWELLLEASEKTQLPILRNALGIASLINNSNKNDILEQIIARCIKLIIEGDGNDTSKYTRIKTIISTFPTKNITLTTNWVNNLKLNYGRIDAIEAFKKEIDQILNYDKKITLNTSKIGYFDFKVLEESLNLAILFEEAHGNTQIRNYCSSLLTRFKTIQQREEFKFITECEKVSKEDYLKNLFGIADDGTKESQIIIIDLNSAEDEVVEIVSAVITRLIFDKLRSTEPRNKFPINLVLEEAHRYIAYDSKRTFLRANQIFDRVAKEGRKYGLFFLISSQRPSELSKTVLSQCSNFIVHRIQNPDDLSHMRQMTPHISEATLKKLPSIPTQHALIFGSAINIPTLFKVNEAEPKPKSDNNEISKNWFVDSNKEFDIFKKN